MTVETLICEDSYVADGTATPRSIGFPILDPDYLRVWRDGAPLTLGTDYSIAGDFRGGTGSIVPSSPWANGAVIRYARSTVIIQRAAIPPGQPLPSRSIEQQLDRQVMIVQEQRDLIDDTVSRALLLPEGEGYAGKYPIVLANGEWGYSVGSGGAGGAGTNISWSILAVEEGQTEFDFSEMPSAIWDVVASAPAAPSFSINGTSLEDEDYSWSAPIFTINDDHIHIDDIVTLDSGVSYDQGVVDRRNVLGLPTYIKDFASSRRANVLDIGDWDATGVHDNASAFDALCQEAVTAGAPLDCIAGKALIGSTINLPDGLTLNGYSHGEEGGDPDYTSCFLIAHSGKGFVSSGNSNAPLSISNITTARSQPAVVPGSPWTPNDHDWDWYYPYINGLKMTRVVTLNATRGIFFNGGRNNIKEWSGQCFKAGLRSDYSYDTCLLQDIHLWPFLLQNDEVRQYTQANLTGFHLKRCDNWFMSQIFSIWHNWAILIDHFPGDGNPAHPAGTASKLKLSQADLDIGNIGYIVAEDANGHTAEFSQVSAQGLNEPSSQPALSIQGPNTRILGDFAGDRCGNVVRHESTATGSVTKLRLSSTSYDIENLAYPAVEVEAGGGSAEILPGSSLVTAGSGGLSAGAVTVWAP